MSDLYTNRNSHGVSFSHGHLHENKQSVINHLSRAIGHLEKVKSMVDEGVNELHPIS